jgi:hypothetical protein
MITPSTYAGWSMSNPWDDAESVWKIYPAPENACPAMMPECTGSYPYLSYQNGWNIETSIITSPRSRPNANASAPVVSVRGRTLSVKLPQSAQSSQSSSKNIQIRMIDLRGKTVSSFNTANASGGSFSLSKIPAGRYIVEVRQAGARLGSC